MKITETTNELEETRSRLESEKKHRQELEKELNLQVGNSFSLKSEIFDKIILKNHLIELNCRVQISIKSEMEVAMKLLEKDIHDKQDTIVSLRRQLDDIKQINLEMYKKLQVK